jgi:hypothetical protein
MIYKEISIENCNEIILSEKFLLLPYKINSFHSKEHTGMNSKGKFRKRKN